MLCSKLIFNLLIMCHLWLSYLLNNDLFCIVSLIEITQLNAVGMYCLVVSYALSFIYDNFNFKYSIIPYNFNTY